LGGEEGHAGFFFGEFVNVLGSFWIELEGGEDEDFGFGMEGAGFFPGGFDLAGFERGVIRAEGDDDAFGFYAFGFGVGVEPARAAEGDDAGEIDGLATFATDAGFEEFVAPIGLAKGGTGTGDGGVEERSGGVAEVGQRWRFLIEIVDGFDVGGGAGFDGEWAGDAGRGVVGEGLVVEGFSPGGSLLAMDLRVTWGTFLYWKPLPTPSLGWASL